jgi:hypothetical protein
VRKISSVPSVASTTICLAEFKTFLLRIGINCADDADGTDASAAGLILGRVRNTPATEWIAPDWPVCPVAETANPQAWVRR